MNRSMILYVVGHVVMLEGVMLLLPCLVSLIYQESEGIDYLVMAVICMLIGAIIVKHKPKVNVFYLKEGCIATALSWIALSIFGALPMCISGDIPSFTDALFETISGFTTTGASILNDVEALSRTTLFWRSFTHWIGGMGVLVFVMMITSLDDENAMPLMRAEVPGPEADKLVPKARHTARLLYGMYFVLTAAEVVFLLFGGMNLYDALLHAFSTAGTGGFSNRAASVSFYDSAYIDGVITVFMILFGINFNLYFFILLKDWKSILKNEELWAYLGIVGVSIAIITGNILKIYGTVAHAFRYASFQVGSIITTTGFATADYDQWPELSKSILLALMFVGACAGSTGGGIKVSRLLIIVKSIRREVRKMLHPNAVTIIKVNGKKIGQDTMKNVNLYLTCYIIIMIVSILLVSIDNFDFATTFSGVLTTMSNVGPGISKVGPVMNFHPFSAVSKLVFCFDMLIGRLEIFPYLLLLSPELWRRRF